MEDKPLTVHDLQRVPPTRPMSCGVCGSSVTNTELHKDWHRLLSRLLAD